jgi:hypothetical protein
MSINPDLNTNADYCEEDRIEHIHGFSHCRCRNKLLPDNSSSCIRFKIIAITEKSRKQGLPDHQLCRFNSDKGYCQLSRMDELALIKRTNINNLHLIDDRIVTEKGRELIEKLMYGHTIAA